MALDEEEHGGERLLVPIHDAEEVSRIVVCEVLRISMDSGGWAGWDVAGGRTVRT